MKKIRLLIADDHMLMRIGFKSFIAGKKDMDCVGEADNGKTAVALTRKLKPDVVVMDLMMPEMNGAEATKAIRAECPATKVVILTSYGNAAELSDALSNGASGVLLKDVSTSELVEAVREIVAGRTILPSGLEIGPRTTAGTATLTQHQREMLAAITRGHSNADIGREFGITENTVKKIVSTILSKIGAANRSEAVAIALRENLV